MDIVMLITLFHTRLSAIEESGGQDGGREERADQGLEDEPFGGNAPKTYALSGPKRRRRCVRETGRLMLVSYVRL